MLELLLQLDSRSGGATAARILTYCAFGAIWGGYGYLANVRSDVPGKQSLELPILAKTMAIGAVAGVIVGLRGDDLTFDTIDTAMVILIPVLDDVINRYIGWTADDREPDRAEPAARHE